ncbi:MAG: 50S ribosomal protein L23 [Candidatus Falkowbacteria bacterium]
MAIANKKNTEAKSTSAKKTTTAKEVKSESMKDLYAKAENGKKDIASKFDGAHRVLVRPLITEKAANFGTLNKYAFVVTGNSNKIEVAKAILAVYGVRPMSINIICVKGKAVSRGRVKGRRSDFKKAIITLKKGDTIKIYEGV